MIKIYENLDINNLENEIWEVIKDFSDCQISNLGRIKSFKQDKINGKIRKLQKNIGGYFYIILYKNGNKELKLINRLVFETFKGKLKDGCDAHHINEDKEDNFIDNLESKLHSKHIGDHNKKRIVSDDTKIKISNNHADFKGENHPNFGKHPSKETREKMSKNNIRKLSNQKHMNIENDIINGILTGKEMAEKYSVSRSMISAIKTGKR
jgi:hypothetical protein